MQMDEPARLTDDAVPQVLVNAEIGKVRHVPVPGFRFCDYTEVSLAEPLLRGSIVAGDGIGSRILVQNQYK